MEEDPQILTESQSLGHARVSGTSKAMFKWSLLCSAQPRVFFNLITWLHSLHLCELLLVERHVEHPGDGPVLVVGGDGHHPPHQDQAGAKEAKSNTHHSPRCTLSHFGFTSIGSDFGQFFFQHFPWIIERESCWCPGWDCSKCYWGGEKSWNINQGERRTSYKS